MTDEWSGGVVATRDGDDPPTVEEWHRIDGERAPAVADASEAVAYRTTLADPRTDDDERALLELRNLGPSAEVWIDGERVAVRDAGLGPLRLEVDPDPEADLVVVREWPPLAGAAGGATDEAATPPDIDLEARRETFLRRLEARPRFGDDEGYIDVGLEVDAGADVDDAITFSVRPVGFRGGATMQRVPIDVSAGERTTVAESLAIRDPSPWWPRGYGDQHRYEVQAKRDGDAIATTVGFRTVSADDGLRVNGTRIRARGVTRWPGGDPATDVDRAIAANANLVRTRGHVPGPAFYDACDEAGVLVWHDLPPADGDGTAVDHYRDLASNLATAYGHRPSLAIYGLPGERARVAGIHGSGLRSRLRFRYRAWRSDADGPEAGTVAKGLSTDRALVTRTGPPGTDPDAASLYSGWRYLAADDLEWLLDRNQSLGRIVAAFGAGSLSRDVDPGAVAGLDATALERRCGPDPDVEASREFQARTVRTVAETLRRRGADVTVAETLRDAHPGGGMGLLEADGTAKPAYRTLARAFEPVQAVLDGPAAPGTVGITLCNDTPDPLEATVGWIAGDAGGETTVTVDPVATTAAGTAEIPADADRVELTVALDDRTVTNSYLL